MTAAWSAGMALLMEVGFSTRALDLAFFVTTCFFAVSFSWVIAWSMMWLFTWVRKATCAPDCELKY
jgi:hypothetical protein